MAVNTDFEGRTYPPTAPYAVGREAIREFAEAVGASHPFHHDLPAARAAGYADLVAPPTFSVVIAQQCEAQFIADPDAGIDFSRVVHAEEKFADLAPIVAGDEVSAVLTVQRVRLVGGHAMVTTRCDLQGRTGPLGSVTSSLVVRGAEES